MTRAYIVKIEQVDPSNDRSEELLNLLADEGISVIDVRQWSTHQEPANQPLMPPGSVPGLSTENNPYL